MNYLREINAFYDWLETNGLSLSAIALWHALMHINNKAAWTDEFAVAVSVLCVKTGLSPRGISDARNELKLKGRISWRSRKGNQSAVYRIIPLTANTAGNEYRQILPAINADNGSGNTADNHTDNDTGNGSALNKLNNTSQLLLIESAQKEILAALQKIGILMPSSVEIEKLMSWIKGGMEPEVVVFAIEKASMANVRRVDYIDRTLMNWHQSGVRTKIQAEAENQRFRDRNKINKAPRSQEAKGEEGSRRRDLIKKLYLT